MRIGFLWGIISGAAVAAALVWIEIEPPAPTQPAPTHPAQSPGDEAGTGTGAGEPEATGAVTGDPAAAGAAGGENRTGAAGAEGVAPAPEADAAAGASAPVAAETDAATAGTAARAGQDPAEPAGPVAALAPAPAIPGLAMPADGAAPAAAAPTLEAPAGPLAPGFDIVRVDAQGQAVIAGHARPGQRVEVLLDGEVVETVRADASGNFVAVISAELNGEARQLQLRVSVSETQPAGAETQPAAGTVARAGTDAAVDAARAQGASSSESAAPAADTADQEPAQPGSAGPVAGAAPGTEPAVAEALADLAAAPDPDETNTSAGSAAPDTDGTAPDSAMPAPPSPGEIVGAAPSAEGLRTPGERAGPADDAHSPATVSQTGDGAASADRPSPAATPESQFGPDAVTAAGEERASDDGAAAGVTDESGAAADAPTTAPPSVRAGIGPGSPTTARAARDSEGTADAADTGAAGGVPSRSSAVAAEQSQDAAGSGADATAGAGAPEPGMRYVLSAPVLILPSQEGEGAPALVQPRSDRLALLQPGGDTPGQGGGGVVLDQVTYDAEGDVLLRGRATDGHAIRAYGDGRLLETVPVREGLWQVSLPRARVEPLLLLRFDEIGPAGEVVSRIETPFRYTGDRPQVVRDREVVIQRGDNLWRIAEQFYGEGVRYSVIYGANDELIRDPDLIYPDQVFTIPELVEAE